MVSHDCNHVGCIYDDQKLGSARHWLKGLEGLGGGGEISNAEQVRGFHALTVRLDALGQ